MSCDRWQLRPAGLRQRLRRVTWCLPPGLCDAGSFPSCCNMPTFHTERHGQEQEEQEARHGSDWSLDHSGEKSGAGHVSAYISVKAHAREQVRQGKCPPKCSRGGGSF